MTLWLCPTVSVNFTLKHVQYDSLNKNDISGALLTVSFGVNGIHVQNALGIWRRHCTLKLNVITQTSLVGQMLIHAMSLFVGSNHSPATVDSGHVIMCMIQSFPDNC